MAWSAGRANLVQRLCAELRVAAKLARARFDRTPGISHQPLDCEPDMPAALRQKNAHGLPMSPVPPTEASIQVKGHSTEFASIAAILCSG